MGSSLRAAPWIALALLYVSLATPAAGREASLAEAGRLFSEGRFDESAALLRALAQAHPGQAIYAFNLGAALLGAGKPAEAIAPLEEVIRRASPLARPAALYLARAELALGRPEAAWARLAPLAKAALPPGLGAEVQDERRKLRDALFARARSLYESGSYAAAREALAPILRDGPDPDAEFLSALAALRLGKNTEADALLARVRSQARDSELSSWAADLLHEGVPFSQAFLRLDLGGGFDTNIYQAAPSSNPESRPIALADLDLRQPFSLGGGAFCGFELFPQWLETIGVPSNRYLYAVASAFAGTGIGGGTQFQFGPTLKYENLGSQSLLLSPGLATSLLAPFQEGWFQLAFSYDRNLSENDAYSYLQGYSVLALGLLAFRFEGGLVELRGGYRLEQNPDLTEGSAVYPLAYSAPVGGAKLGLSLSEDWALTSWINAEWRSYPTLARPENAYRSDLYLEIGARASWLLARRWQAFGTLSQLVNLSNLGATSSYDRDFDETRLVFGVTFQAGEPGVPGT